MHVNVDRERDMWFQFQVSFPPIFQLPLKIARQFCLSFSNPTRRIVSLTGWASYKLQNHQVWLLESLFVQPPGPHTDFVDWSRSAVLSGVSEYLCSRCISANNMYSTLHHTPPVYPPNAWQTRCNNPPFDVYDFQSPLSLASHWYIVYINICIYGSYMFV